MIKYTTIESAINTFAALGTIYNNKDKFPETTGFVKDVYNYCNSYLNDCDVGVLWNALTEKDSKEILKYYFTDNIYADSGGLQMVTLGLDPTDEDREEIYKRQLEYSTHAMSFDKMPILVKEEEKKDNSPITNHNSKYFIKDMVYNAGRESGYNVLNQCKVFSENEGDSKIMVIIQGSSFEDYLTYAEGLFSVFNELDSKTREKYYKQIHGLSFGVSGITNYFDLIDLYVRAPVEIKSAPKHALNNLHFLGIGGHQKVLPFYVLKDTFFDGIRDNVHYSFDSTSRTSASVYGKYTELKNINNKFELNQYKLGKKYDEIPKRHLEVIMKRFGGIINKHLNKKVNSVEDMKENYSIFSDDGLGNANELMDFYGEEKGYELYMDRRRLYYFLSWANELITFFDVLKASKKGNFNFIRCSNLRRALTKLSSLDSYHDYMKHREYFRLLLENKLMNNINILDTKDEFDKCSNLMNDEW